MAGGIGGFDERNGVVMRLGVAAPFANAVLAAPRCRRTSGTNDIHRKDAMMLKRKANEVKEQVAGGAELAAALARDRKFRRQLLAAIGHAESARRRAASRIGVLATAQRLAAD